MKEHSVSWLDVGYGCYNLHYITPIMKNKMRLLNDLLSSLLCVLAIMLKEGGSERFFQYAQWGRAVMMTVKKSNIAATHEPYINTARRKQWNDAHGSLSGTHFSSVLVVSLTLQ